MPFSGKPKDFATDDAVDTEALEVVTADEAHEPLDGDERNHKGHNAAHAQDSDLVGTERAALDEVLDQLERTRAKHDGNGQEERKLGRHRTRAAQKQAADDGRTGARRTRHQRKHLEAADTQRSLPAQVLECGDGAKVQILVIVLILSGSRGRRRKVRTGGTSARHHSTRTKRTGNGHFLALVRAPVLDHDKQHAVHNERQRHDGSIVEMLLHPVVERQADRRGGNAAEHNLAPQHPSVATALLALAGRERIELMVIPLMVIMPWSSHLQYAQVDLYMAIAAS